MNILGAFKSFMKYIILIGKKEYGLVSSDVLIEWVNTGRVLPGTQVRNSMINKWHEAREYDFLINAFARQKINHEQNILKKRGTSEEDLKSDLRIAKEEKYKEEHFTAYKNPFLPDPAHSSLRVFATLFDYALIAGVVFCFFHISFLGQISFIINLNPIFYLFLLTGIIFWLAYYTICLGVFAQTFGMWFWGILLVCNGDDAKPVSLSRAFLYTAFMLFFGILSPFFIFISGGKRALHDIFSGTQVVRISARLK